MKRWHIIVILILVSVIFVAVGKKLGNIPETQHNGASLCLSCIGVGE
jgi:hypothetical protein